MPEHQADHLATELAHALQQLRIEFAEIRWTAERDPALYRLLTGRTHPSIRRMHEVGMRKGRNRWRKPRRRR